MHPDFEPERLYPLPMPLRKYAQMACQHSASDTDIQRFSLYARNTSWKSVLPVYWQLLDPGRIPPAASLEDALAPEWPHSARLTAALGAIKTLLLHLQQRDPRPARASTSSVEYALWNRLFPWMCFFQQYDPALPLGCRASPELGIFLPFLHFTVAVFQPMGRELNDLYSRAPGLARLVFHIWSLIVEDRGKEDELGYHALTVLLPQELTPAVASEAIEGVGGTLEDVATLISKHIRVFAPRISRRVRGAEMLLPNGIHLGVFQTVLKTARAFSTYDLRVQRSLPADSEHHVTRFSRILAETSSVVALTRCIKELGKIPTSKEVLTQKNSAWDASLHETIALLSAALTIQRRRMRSALRHGLVPALARCCQRPLSELTARMAALFVTEILQPATMMRSLTGYLQKDREAVMVLVRETRAMEELPGPRIMEVWSAWCDIVQRHSVFLQHTEDHIVCTNILCDNNESDRHFRQCSGCAARLYCSRKCQKEDWKLSHREICTTARAVRLSLVNSFSSSNLRSIQLILQGHYLLDRAEYQRHAALVEHQFSQPAIILRDFVRWQPDKCIPLLEAFPVTDQGIRARILADDPTWDDWVARTRACRRNGMVLHVARLPVGSERGPYHRFIVYPLRMNTK